MCSFPISPVLMFIHVLLSVVSVVAGMGTGANILAVTRFAGELRWGSNVSIFQEPGSIVLVLLMNSGHVGHEPCTEFGALCCLGDNLRSHVWGGDFGVLNQIKDSCDSGVNDAWKRVLEPLSLRQDTEIGFNIDDMRDTVKTGYAVDSLHRIRVMTLILQTWDGCDGGVNNRCIIRVGMIDKTLEVDLSNAQRVSSVSVSEPCTSNNKPPHSFWVLSSDPDKCEWLCDSGFSQCPGHSEDSVDQICHLLPSSGAVLRVSAALTISTEPTGEILDKISSSVAQRFRDAGVVGTEDCAVIIRNDANQSASIARVELPVVNGRIRVITQSHYDGVSLRERLVTDKPNEPISIELDNIDDRLLPGFLAVTLLVYSNNTRFSLATQAVLLRYVLNDALRVTQDVGVVLYVSEVQGVMRGLLYETFALSKIQIIILVCWVSVIVILSLSSIFGSWRCISGTAVPNPQETVALPPSQWCGEHSPRDRVLLTSLFICIVGIIPVTVILYMTFVLPSITTSTSSENTMNPLVMLGWLWVMIVIWLLATVMCCCIAKLIRRSV